MDEEATCGNMMKVRRWQCRPLLSIIIPQDVETACRQGRNPRRGDDRVVEEGGRNGSERTMGRQVGGRILIRAGKGRAEDSMMLRKETKSDRSWLVFSATHLRKGYVSVKPSIAFSAISSKIKEKGRGVATAEGKRKERDVELFPVTTRQKTTIGRMRKGGSRS